MPMKPRVPCKHPGCAPLISSGTKYCEAHRALHPEEVRSAAGRGYGAAWRKASKQFLEAHPLCEECRRQGKYTKATVVDHIEPHRGDPKPFWDEGNWQGLCKRHHDQKTGKADRWKEYKY